MHLLWRSSRVNRSCCSENLPIGTPTVTACPHRTNNLGLQTMQFHIEQHIFLRFSDSLRPCSGQIRKKGKSGNLERCTTDRDYNSLAEGMDSEQAENAVVVSLQIRLARFARLPTEYRISYLGTNSKERSTAVSQGSLRLLLAGASKSKTTFHDLTP